MTHISIYFYVGVRDMPERDIESLGVMGWWLDAARIGNYSVAVAAVALPIVCASCGSAHT